MLKDDQIQSHIEPALVDFKVAVENLRGNFIALAVQAGMDKPEPWADYMTTSIMVRASVEPADNCIRHLQDTIRG